MFLDDIYKLIASYCDLYTLINLTQTCQSLFDILQPNLFVDHCVKFSKNYNYYNIMYAHELRNESELTDDDLLLIPYLIKLNLSNNNMITDEGLKHLSQLEYLNIDNNKNITNEGIKNLIHLRTLILNNNNFTDICLKNLINLSELHLKHNNNITDDEIKQLIHLKKLYISNYVHDKYSLYFCIDDIKHFEISPSINIKITRDGLNYLPNLKHIYLSNDPSSNFTFETYMRLALLMSGWEGLRY